MAFFLHISKVVLDFSQHGKHLDFYLCESGLLALTKTINLVDYKLQVFIRDG